jgi:hypothetical protein
MRELAALKSAAAMVMMIPENKDPSVDVRAVMDPL